MKYLKWTDTVANKSFELFDNEISTIEGFEYPSVRDVVEDISGPQSSIFITSKFGRRDLSVMGIKRSQSFEDRANMIGVFRQDGRMRLFEFVTLDNLELQAEVVVKRILYPYNQVKKPFLIEMVAPDWRFYSQELFENDSADENQMISNQGNETTNPIFEIVGPFTSATILNYNNFEQFTIEYEVAEGESITIDTLNRTVTLNNEYGETSVYSSMTGDFVSLLSGENTLGFDVVGDSGSTSLVTRWRSAYNGV